MSWRCAKPLAWSAMLIGLGAGFPAGVPAAVDGAAPTPPAEIASAVRLALGGAAERAVGPLAASERRELSALYELGGYAPLWVEASGRPTADAQRALALAAGAAADGLDPAEYGAEILGRWAAALDAAPDRAAADVAAFDTGTSAATLRYLRQLHEGRVDPRAIGFHMAAPAADDHDFPALLRTALAEHRLTETAAALAPPLVLYRGLRAALSRYRVLATEPPPSVLAELQVPLRPGDSSAAAGDLRRLLAALGDLPVDESTALAPLAPVAGYDGALVAAVRRFQNRHGLVPDGVIGRHTLAALQVPMKWRARQIELALERLRWLPHLSADRFLAVNIPMYRLWVWNAVPPDGAPRLGMNVIVGRALHRQTPVFVEEMREVIFRPYWNIPLSIARREILPAIGRDADYLRRHDMEIVAGPGDDARAVAATADNLARVRAGKLRVRQRPGPNNSLGLIKFVFPNGDNVYLHDTPAPQLFARERRDFSHGCVRVEDPIGLAEWALESESGWTRARIEAAMQGADSQHVRLSRPIQVILFYVTAVVLPEDGAVHFAEDVYGHDLRLHRALAAGRLR